MIICEHVQGSTARCHTSTNLLYGEINILNVEMKHTKLEFNN